MKAKPINELVEIAENLGIEDVGRLKKQEIIFRIFKKQAKDGIKFEIKDKKEKTYTKSFDKKLFKELRKKYKV